MNSFLTILTFLVSVGVFVLWMVWVGKRLARVVSADPCCPPTPRGMTLLAVELVSFGFAWLLPIGLLVLREAGATSAQQVLFWVATCLLVLTPCFLWLQ